MWDCGNSARNCDTFPSEGTVEGRRVSTPKGLSVSLRVRWIHSDSSSGPRAAAPRMPSPPAFDTAAANSGVDAPPMPASRIGYLMPNMSHSGVCSILSDIECEPPYCRRIVRADTSAEWGRRLEVGGVGTALVSPPGVDSPHIDMHEGAVGAGFSVSCQAAR